MASPSEPVHRVLLETTHLGGVPVLHAAPVDGWAQPLPTVLACHGFTRSKELDSNLAVALAQSGLRVVMPEADGHGARFDGDAARRLARFWPIVQTCVDGLDPLRCDLENRGWVRDGRIAVAGLSMGGFVALAALVRYPWVCAAVSWMGSGFFGDLSRTLYPPLGAYTPATAAAHGAAMAPLEAYDPSLHLDRLADRPLWLWHGARDEVVPCSESTRLYANLVQRGWAGQAVLVTDPNATHKLTAGGMEAGVAFLAQALNPGA